MRGFAPDMPSLSEERALLARLPYKGSFFLIDPLDGTKEFVAGRNEFTVNLALVTDGTPLLGIVGAPALGLIWRGIVGRGAERLTLARWCCPLEGADPHPPLPAARTALDGRGQPLAWRCQDGSLHCGETRRGAHRTRLGGQIRPGRRRRGRYLSPPVADLRMGRRGGPRGGYRRRRQDHGFKGRGAQVRPGRKDFLVPEFIAWGDPAAVPA